MFCFWGTICCSFPCFIVWNQKAIFVHWGVCSLHQHALTWPVAFSANYFHQLWTRAAAAVVHFPNSRVQWLTTQWSNNDIIPVLFWQLFFLSRPTADTDTFTCGWASKGLLPLCSRLSHLIQIALSNQAMACVSLPFSFGNIQKAHQPKDVIKGASLFRWCHLFKYSILFS